MLNIFKFNLIFLLCCIISSVLTARDPCSDIPTCEECVAETFCGWCSEFIVYENGKRGRNCAYQGPDAVPFVCPKDYQTETCTPEEYICNNVTYQCVPADVGTGGVDIDECVKSCFPPTYECNEDKGECELTEPGKGTSFDVCNSTCGKEPEDMYVCDPQTLECRELEDNESGGTTLDVCEDSCGKASNNTPAFTKGMWRGLQISKGYKEGEWRMIVLEDNSIMIERPDKSVFEAGILLQMNNELWIQNNVGIRRGLFMTTQMPTVIQWTWALGNPGEIVPNNFDSAMEESTPSTVFVFYKCLEGTACDFSTLAQPHIQRRLNAKRTLIGAGIDDKCAVHEDCETCIGDKENRCGWCDVNVYYKNGTVEGKNCAGHNSDGTKDPFVCNSVYSTETCVFPTAEPATAEQDTSSETANEETRYGCNASSVTCEEQKGGSFEFLVDCEQQCVEIPDIPVDLIGTWRGLEIREGFVVGEFRAEIEAKKVAFMSPDGRLSIGTISMIGEFIILDFQQGPLKGRITTRWQLSYSAETRNLAWAWGEPGKDAPANFQEGLKKPNTEFVFVACLFGKPVETCSFSF